MCMNVSWKTKKQLKSELFLFPLQSQWAPGLYELRCLLPRGPRQGEEIWVPNIFQYCFLFSPAFLPVHPSNRDWSGFHSACKNSSDLNIWAEETLWGHWCRRRRRLQILERQQRCLRRPCNSNITDYTYSDFIVLQFRCRNSALWFIMWIIRLLWLRLVSLLR